jgi:hypothetical protein
MPTASSRLRSTTQVVAPSSDSHLVGWTAKPDRVSTKSSDAEPHRSLSNAKSRRHSTAALEAMAAIWLAAIIVTASGTPSGAATSQATAIAPSLHVVGALESSGDMVVLVNLTKQGTLQLTGLDVASGRVVWQLPYSTSDLTPGVYSDPQISHGVVVDLEPVAGSYPSVVIRGIDVATGSVKWRLAGNYVVDDDILSCLGGSDFCISIETQSGTDLGILDATSGHLIGNLPGIERAMDGEGLYETSAAAPTFEEIGPNGAPAWSRPTSALFGSGYTPNTGWDIEARSGLDVGTIGVTIQGLSQTTYQLAPGGGNENLSASKSVGFKRSNGELVWSASGMYDCGGVLDFLTTPVLCQFTGNAHITSLTEKSPVFQHVTLTFAGLNPQTGAISWHQPVLNYVPLVNSAAVPFLDGSHVVVRGPRGLEILNTASGAVSSPGASSHFWCENVRTYKLAGVDDYAHGERVAAPTFASCSPSGIAASGLPLTQPSAVGVKAAGMFVWVSPGGLEAERL